LLFGLSSSLVRLRCCGSFKLGHTGLDILDLDRLGGVTEDCFGCPNAGGCRRTLVDHNLQQRGGGARGR
jgi:hypothetical protein